MKTKKKTIIIKEELKNQNQKIEKKSDGELDQVTGGIAPGRTYWKQRAIQ